MDINSKNVLDIACPIVPATRAVVSAAKEAAELARKPEALKAAGSAVLGNLRLPFCPTTTFNLPDPPTKNK